MESCRKRKADTYLVGFMGRRLCGAANCTSAGSMPSREVWSYIDAAPSMEQIMRRAGSIESRHLRADWSDEHESTTLAHEAFERSQQELTAAGYLP
jgi:hypothetical protein